MMILISRAILPVCASALLITSASSVLAQDASSGPDALSETYRDWVVSCRNVSPQDSQSDTRLCEMTQDLRRQDGGQRVLSVALRPAEDTQVGVLTLITPFGLKVSDLVTVEIDDTAVLQAPFETCLPAGCIVQAQIDQAALTAMQRGENAVVRLPTTAGETFQVSISLLGFTAAWNRLGGL